jgi:tripartite ATP-independent transporter DctM subunit
MGVAMMVVVYRFAHVAKLPVEPRATRAQVLRALWDGALALFMPAIVLGSIVLGIATPTEAAVVAVLYALVLGVFVYREIKWSELPEIFTSVAITSAAVMVTVAAAQLFGWITAAEGLGNAIGKWLTTLTTNPHVVLLLINVVLLVLGMFMEPIPIMLLTVPILFPVITKLGIDPVHFGVVVTLNLMIGCLTPPVGINLFLASAISGVPVMRVARASTAFIVVLLVVLALITYVPQLVLWLPHLVQAGS